MTFKNLQALQRPSKSFKGCKPLRNAAKPFKTLRDGDRRRSAANWRSAANRRSGKGDSKGSDRGLFFLCGKNVTKITAREPPNSTTSQKAAACILLPKMKIGGGFSRLARLHHRLMTARRNRRTKGFPMMSWNGGGSSGRYKKVILFIVASVTPHDATDLSCFIYVMAITRKRYDGKLIFTPLDSTVLISKHVLLISGHAISRRPRVRECIND